MFSRSREKTQSSYFISEMPTSRVVFIDVCSKKMSMPTDWGSWLNKKVEMWTSKVFSIDDCSNKMPHA